MTTEGRYGDGRGGLGLSLLVKKTAKRPVVEDLVAALKDRRENSTTLGLGSFPAVTLAMARSKVLDNARRVEGGEDIRKPPPSGSNCG